MEGRLEEELGGPVQVGTWFQWRELARQEKVHLAARYRQQKSE